MTVRLDKLIADAGHGTRKQVRRLIRSGRVFVDERLVNDPGFHVEREKHDIRVDDEPVRQSPLTVMLRKPPGVVTATKDARHKTVLDFLPDNVSRHIFPAGRLDKDSEGLVILTEDGKLCHRVISPNSGIEKEYVARVSGRVEADLPDRFAGGIELADGTVTKPAQFSVLDSDPDVDSTAGDGAVVRVTITEGKYHQVRRMCAACGLHVEALRRVRIGRLRLDPSLAPGAYRELTPTDIDLLLTPGPMSSQT